MNEIRAAGAKLTRPRKRVLTTLYKMRRPLTITEIHNICPDIDFASVYRTIKLFAYLDIVLGISMGDKQLRYELNRGEHHHHILCSECGGIQQLDICFLKSVQKITDYQITNHSIEFIGVCPACRAD